MGTAEIGDTGRCAYPCSRKGNRALRPPEHENNLVNFTAGVGHHALTFTQIGQLQVVTSPPTLGTR